MNEIQRNALYDVGYWVDENPLIISNYSYLYQATNRQFKYNKIAINDILTLWTPRKNPVLE